MEALKKKFKSRRGASMLLAMLFLMVCMVVGSSVMIAAAFNLNKVRAVQEEQQKYLAVSSALNLLVDELESVQYFGRFSCVDTLVENGGPGSGDYYSRIYQQQPGELRYISGGVWALSKNGSDDGVLPLHNDLDGILQGKFGTESETTLSDAVYDVDGNPFALKCTYEGLSPTPSTGPYTLTVNDGHSDVTIKVKLEDTNDITLTAELEDGSYSMTAVMEARGALSAPAPGVGIGDVESDLAPIYWQLMTISKN